MGVTEPSEELHVGFSEQTQNGAPTYSVPDLTSEATAPIGLS